MAGERFLDNKTPGKVQSDKKYRCQHCRYATDRRDSMYNHQHTHFSVKPYKCEFCEKRFALSSYLKAHINAQHKNCKWFSCPDCTHKTKRKGDLTRHGRIHSEVKPYACQECDFTTKHDWALHRHIAKHTGEKKYFCPKCEYSCITSYGIKLHLATHTGVKKQKCPHCDYSCILSRNMEDHVATHTGVRNHKCPHCDYSCIQRSNLKRHIQARHSGVKKQNCPHCDYSCKRKGTLKRHIKARHCEFSSLTLADLQAHSCPPVFSCAQCGAEYMTKRTLDIHTFVYHKNT